MKVDRALEASVIVPSYNGAKKLPELMRSILTQTSQAIEVIIVVDGSTDNTEEVLQRYDSTIPNLRIIVQENGGRSVARNAGARKAASDLLIFYDDDVVPDPQSVEKHISFHKKYFGIVCGEAVEQYGIQKTDVQNYKAWLTAKWTNKYAKGLTQMTLDGLFFAAANCSAPSTAFWQLGGFNETLTDAEDHDLAVRALHNEIPVYYDRTNRAIHNDIISCKSYIKRLREYATACKRTGVRESSAKKGTTMIETWKRVVYRSFAFPFWVRLIDSGCFVILPKPLRYRLYSIIIQSLAYEYGHIRL